MNKLKAIIDNRLISGFPVSIKTGLALETIFTPILPVYDDTRVVKKYRVKKGDIYAINLFTLIRNLLTSIEYIVMKDIIRRDIEEPLIDAILKEIEVINGLCIDNNMSLIIYTPNFDTIKELNKNKDNKHYTGIMTIINAICESVDNKIIKEIKNMGIETDLKHRTNIITTHMMVDMIDISNKTVLLESNTGNIVDRKHRAKKLNLHKKDIDVTKIPLNFTTLFVWGDDSKYIIPYGIKIKRMFYEELMRSHSDYTKSNEWCRTRLIKVMRQL